MSKIILLGADWCPITQAAQKLFAEIKKFDYEYIDIDTNRGEKLVDQFLVTDVPKTIAKDRIIFHGLPPKKKLIQLINQEGQS